MRQVLLTLRVRATRYAQRPLASSRRGAAQTMTHWPMALRSLPSGQGFAGIASHCPAAFNASPRGQSVETHRPAISSDPFGQWHRKSEPIVCGAGQDCEPGGGGGVPLGCAYTDELRLVTSARATPRHTGSLECVRIDTSRGLDCETAWQRAAPRHLPRGQTLRPQNAESNAQTYCAATINARANCV
jgi:hypothetical protein